MNERLLPDVARIAVLRPNAIGDYVFTLPALHALRAAYPQARITLLGKAWHRDFLAGRPGPVDEVIAMPPVPGVGAAAGQAVDEAAVEAFVADMQARRFDLVLQLFGGGASSNPFARRLGARWTIGLRADGAPALDRWIRYEPWRNERLRLLEVVALAGAAPTDLAPCLELIERDRQALREALDLPAQLLAVLQPGASDERRRWPAERFAAVGDALAQAGAAVVINGSAAERELSAEVARAMRAHALDAGGGLPLPALAALLARARVLVSNDTGPLHLAQALGTPSVGVFWALNLVTAEPLVSGPHRFAFSARLACPVCGVVNVHERCAHQRSFVEDVGVEEVRALALEAFREA